MVQWHTYIKYGADLESIPPSHTCSTCAGEAKENNNNNNNCKWAFVTYSAIERTSIKNLNFTIFCNWVLPEAMIAQCLNKCCNFCYFLGFFLKITNCSSNPYKLDDDHRCRPDPSSSSIVGIANHCISRRTDRKCRALLLWQKEADKEERKKVVKLSCCCIRKKICCCRWKKIKRSGCVGCSGKLRIFF